MKKEDKGLLIDSIGAEIAKYPHVYLVDIEGLNSSDTVKLRKLCFRREVKLLVVKNKLLIKAMEKSDIDYSELFRICKGATSIMLSNVNNAPAKLIKDFRTSNEKPLLKAAYVEESFYIGNDSLDELVAIKSKNELIADIISTLMSPAKNVVSSLQHNSANTLSGIVKTLSERAQ